MIVRVVIVIVMVFDILFLHHVQKYDSNYRYNYSQTLRSTRDIREIDITGFIQNVVLILRL